MAESGPSKGGTFAKVIQKRVFRTKEKLLENLGKADRTTDEVFEENVINFQKQQSAANKLHKEIQNYLKCVKAMSLASNSFYSAIKDTYEDDWYGYAEVCNAVESLSMLWDDYLTSLVEQVQGPLQSYIARFPDVKNKINKRNRKLTDFDSCRHNLSTQQNAKKPDHGKVQKAKEELEESRRIYEELNNELHEDLPALYDNRINFLASNFQTFFTSEGKFQEESAKIKTQISNATERLSNETSLQAFGSSIRGGRHISGDRQPSEEGSENSGNLATFYKIHNDIDDRGSETERKSTPRESGGDSDDVISSPHVNHKANGLNQDEDDMVETPPEPPEQHTEPPYEPVTIGLQMRELPTNGTDYDVPEPTSDDIYKVPLNNQPIDNKLPKGVLYQVQATHPYTGEDTDELTFEAGDIINVVPYDDPEDQDEGWLMGIKDDDKGVFPANFTKRI